MLKNLLLVLSSWLQYFVFLSEIEENVQIGQILWETKWTLGNLREKIEVVEKRQWFK